MKQYTLLVMTPDKVVHMRVFNTKEQLFEIQRYFIDGLGQRYFFKSVKEEDLKPIDKDGYVWFVEPEEDLDEVLYEATSFGMPEDLRKHNDELLEKDLNDLKVRFRKAR